MGLEGQFDRQALYLAALRGQAEADGHAPRLPRGGEELVPQTRLREGSIVARVYQAMDADQGYTGPQMDALLGLPSGRGSNAFRYLVQYGLCTVSRAKGRNNLYRKVAP